MIAPQTTTMSKSGIIQRQPIARPNCGREAIALRGCLPHANAPDRGAPALLVAPAVAFANGDAAMARVKREGGRRSHRRSRLDAI